MEEKTYEFKLSRNEFRYEFISISDEKRVNKIVLFTETKTLNLFNLALLDVLENGDLSDSTETKNKDLKVVLATVIQIVNDFLSKNPNFLIAFKGSEEKRQRLYRIIIGKELTKILKKFEVYGVINNTIYIFEKNIEYDFYLIKKR